MTEALIDTAKSVAEEIAGKQEIGVYLSILDNAGGTLEDFVLGTCKFCVEKSPVKNGHQKKVDDSARDRCRDLVESVIDYGTNLVFGYDNHNRFELFSTTLKALEPLDCNDKQKYINQFNGFIEIEKQINTPPILHLIIQRVLGGLVGKYQPKFENLEGHNIKRDNSLYQTLVEQLKTDLGIFVQYTLDKLQQNAQFNNNVDGIGYCHCFPTQEECDKLTPDYVHALIEQDEKPEQLIRPLIGEVGVPLGMGMRGNRKTDPTTIIIYYGLPASPQNVRLEHSNGLSNTDAEFYLALSCQITKPLLQFNEETKKVRNSLSRMLGYRKTC
ncbi:hypothetical protein CEE44_01385 [Candidatus Woesearchaeota archaeon B3_Woes]|nr:MAG: hypothetical protein CEE44_01385 [Candidatus Woesearchaeota archaeon B3_Woes]